MNTPQRGRRHQNKTINIIISNSETTSSRISKEPKKKGEQEGVLSGYPHGRELFK